MVLVSKFESELVDNMCALCCFVVHANKIYKT